MLVKTGALGDLSVLVCETTFTIASAVALFKLVLSLLLAPVKLKCCEQQLEQQQNFQAQKKTPCS